MLSAIDVKCPHCGACGQIILPPVGAIILGPCPQCEEWVVVFQGSVLPMRKDTMLNGTLKDRRRHLLSVLSAHLKHYIETMITDEPIDENGEIGDFAVLSDSATDSEERDEPSAAEKQPQRPPISQDEFDHFREIDLRLLDNTDYFRSVFD